ncbi:hypothetical protein AeRB84_004163 [Aphanomyces euteiches]|nr:hypothetical protein AeRB84_004163 [Aphanomyces euteiches]
MQELFCLIDQSKKLVEWFKRTNQQSQLDKTLKQENATRWNSLLRCLRSIYDMFDKVVDIKVSNIPQTLLKEFIDFLDVFQQATLALEQFKQPTLHKVIYWRHVLHCHLQPVLADILGTDGNVEKNKDSASIAAIKKILQPILVEKFVVQDLHVQGALLDPKMKNRLLGHGVEPGQVASCKAGLKELMLKYGRSLDLDLFDDSTPPPLKKARQNTSMYDAVSDDDDEEVEAPEWCGNSETQVDLEYKAYMAYKVGEKEFDEIASMHDREFRVLLWWKHKGAMLFPIMALVARSILCVPASSAMSENNFSDAGNTITKKRNPAWSTILCFCGPIETSANEKRLFIFLCAKPMGTASKPVMGMGGQSPATRSVGWAWVPAMNTMQDSATGTIAFRTSLFIVIVIRENVVRLNSNEVSLNLRYL